MEGVFFYTFPINIKPPFIPLPIYQAKIFLIAAGLDYDGNNKIIGVLTCRSYSMLPCLSLPS